MKTVVLVCGLAVLVMMSAFQLLTTRYETRLLVIRLQELQVQRDELERDWGQLLLEQGTWSTHSRIEDLARSKLNMTIPNVKQLRRIRS